MGGKEQTAVLVAPEPQPQHFVTDMAQVKAIVDPVRLTLLEMLANREMTSRELADELNISQQLTYHHLQKLIESGLCQITRTGRRGNLEVYYYRAIAKTFEFALPAINKQAIDSEIKRHVLADKVIDARDAETADILAVMGFDISSFPAFVSWGNDEASFFLKKYEELSASVPEGQMAGKTWESVVAAMRIGTLAAMSDAEFDGWIATVRRLREVVKPMAKAAA